MEDLKSKASKYNNSFKEENKIKILLLLCYLKSSKTSNQLRIKRTFLNIKDFGSIIKAMKILGFVKSIQMGGRNNVSYRWNFQQINEISNESIEATLLIRSSIVTGKSIDLLKLRLEMRYPKIKFKETEMNWKERIISNKRSQK